MRSLLPAKLDLLFMRVRIENSFYRPPGAVFERSFAIGFDCRMVEAVAPAIPPV
jgi:hypothetical protein